MNLVLFTHPSFLGLTSQGHFARALAQAYLERGHSVQVRQPEAVFRRLVTRGVAAKWAGYLDQYLIFPVTLVLGLRHDPPQTLYVVCDQALGPWVPYLAHRAHVLHCHDLLALRSALGEVPQNPTSLSGRIYQRYIRWGFRHARNFISVSQKTRADLHRYGAVRPAISEVVYNGLNWPYERLPHPQAMSRLAAAGLPVVAVSPVPAVEAAGFLLHVGGGQWYKNSSGVLALYASYVRSTLASGAPTLPLWMVSPAPSQALRTLIQDLPAPGRVEFFGGLDGGCLQALYSSAELLLFPSLAEGFGWPIAEALACGCAVLTTAQAPMNEVGGPVARYLPLLQPGADVAAWADDGARVVGTLLARSSAERQADAEAAIAWAARFAPERSIESYLHVYGQVLAAACPQPETVNAP